MINEPSFTLNSTRPYFACFTVSTSSCYFTKVPDLMLGISPLGPRILAKAFREGICSGVAIILSNGIMPSSTSLNVFSLPMKSAPLAVSSGWNSSPQKTHTLTSFPVPDGKMQVPLTIWSPCVGSTASFSTTSKLSTNLRSLDSYLARSKTSTTSNSFYFRLNEVSWLSTVPSIYYFTVEVDFFS